MISHYYKNNKKYYAVFVKVRNKDGKQINRRRRGITSERRAKELEYELKTELLGIINADVPLSFEAWHEECLKRMKFTHKHSTLIGYDSALKKCLSKEWNKRLLTEFTKQHVHELIFETLSEVSANRKRNTFKKIQRLFEMAVEEGIFAKNPAHGLKIKVPEPKQTVLNSKEAAKLLEKAKESAHRFYPIWAFALLTGMRSGEMMALRWSDIDLETGLISVTKQWTSKDGLHETKANRNRVVPISSELETFLKELRLKGMFADKMFLVDKRIVDGELVQNKKWVAHSDYVLPHLEEWKYGDQALVLRDFCRVIGITEVKFHDLRATFITNMLAHGVPLVSVMAIVGHRKMSTTDRYLRLAGVGIKGATDKLGYGVPEEKDHHVIQLFPNKG